jgi:two-component system NarL family response regulator
MDADNGRCITVLVADDHAILRRGLTDIINQEPGMRVIAEAGDGPEAVRLYSQYLPDVALIDLAMPGFGGVEVIRMIKASHPNARVVILTTYDTDEDVELAFKAGGQAYLLKDIAPQHLVEAIRDVIRGRKRVAPAIAEKLADRVARVQLTGREFTILRLVTEGKANKEIAATLGISNATVKAHITSLLSKLNVCSRTQAIAVAIKRGLVRPA